MSRKAVLIIAVIAALVLLFLAGTGMAGAKPLSLFRGFAVPTAAALLAAGICGGGLVWGFATPTLGTEQKRAIAYAAILPLVLATATLLLAAAVASGSIGPAKAALVLVLATLATLAGIRCFDQLAEGGQIGIESHWGGLGGSSGGWRLLPPTGLAILALSFAGGALALAVAEPADKTSNATDPADTANEAASANEADAANEVAASNAASGDNSADSNENAAADPAGATPAAGTPPR